MLKRNGLNRHWLLRILQRKISFSCNMAVHRFHLNERSFSSLQIGRTWNVDSWILSLVAEPQQFNEGIEQSL